MANSFLTEESGHIAATAVAMLRDSLVLGRLVHRDAEGEFHGRVGNSVNIEIPGHAGGAIDIAQSGDIGNSKISTYNDVKDDSQALKLTNHFAHPVKLTAKEMTLDVDDFASRVLARQVRELAEKVEGSIAALLNTEISAVKTTDAVTDAAKILSAVTAAGVLLDENGVSEDGRVIVASPQSYGLLVDNEILTKVNESGATGALRKAEVGEVRGFTVYKSNFVKEGMVAMSRQAFIAAIVPPAAAMGTKSASVSEGGYGLRWLQDFDMGSVSDLSVLDTFFGAAKTKAQKTHDGRTLVRSVAIRTSKVTSGG
ncbi:P22 phage major capsid protein family protein [Kitasatospora sp. NPDC001664]